MIHCQYCNEPITSEPVIKIVERNIAREGIEADVECIEYYCSEECKNDNTLPK